MSVSEKLFEGLISSQGKRGYCFKLTDAKEVIGTNKRKGLKTKPQPCDYLVVLHKQMFTAEVKESENPTRFPLSNIRPGQLAHARMIHAAGGAYFFFLYQLKTGTWFKVPAPVIYDHPGRSIAWTELQPYVWSV